MKSTDYYSNKREVMLVLESLPTNSLMVIAAELMALETVEREELGKAASSFITDVFNIGGRRMGDDFLKLVDIYYQYGRENGCMFFQKHQDQTIKRG